NGMTPMAAIVAGTSNAADLMGWSQAVGSVLPGRYADLVAVRGNPLDDISILEDVSVVMMNGEVVVDRR
ncbi:MAG: amidohydrolase family protein, partial [Gemmatimonadales bacterium]